MGKDKETGLTDRQQQFCQEYIIDLNATKAAIRAHYSPDTARQIGCELLTKVNIQDYISELKQVRAKRCKISQDNVLKELGKIGFIDIRDLYREDGRLKLPHELSDQAAASLASLEIEEIFEFNPVSKDKEKVGEVKKVRLHNKISALELLGKHVGIFEKDNAQKKQDLYNPEVIAAIAAKINGNAK